MKITGRLYRKSRVEQTVQFDILPEHIAGRSVHGKFRDGKTEHFAQNINFRTDALPFAWSKKGYNNFENYRALIQEKYEELVESVDNECKIP